jgi:transglutaminase-like putative cysteine protease
MVFRYSWIAGLAALVFAFAELNALLRPSIDGIPWQFAVLAAAVLGIVLTWAAVTYRLPAWSVVVINLIAFVIAITQIAAPSTRWGFLPTADTWDLLYVQLDQAASVIRSGIEPVVPLTGIIIVVMAVFWVAGIVLAWGLTTGHPYVALIPPLVLTLQFTTMDRVPTSMVEVVLFTALVGWAILAAATDERSGTSGRMVSRSAWPPSEPGPAPAAVGLLAVSVVAAAFAVGTLQDRIPRDGALRWRNPSGLTGGFFGGSISYNPFIQIQQQLVSGTDTPVFRATIQGDVPPDEVYFQLLTMETYNGGQFFAFEPEVVTLDDRPYESERHAFAGPSVPVTIDVEIDALRQEWLPSTYSVQSVSSSERNERLMFVRQDDSAVFFETLSSRGMTYELQSRIPQPDARALATTTSGELSPSFAQAAAQRDAVASLAPEPLSRQEVLELRRENPPDRGRYVALPEDPDARIDDIRRLAAGRTTNLGSDFERGLALEAWFHSEAFSYKLLSEEELGHGATDLAAWLLDPDSANHHQGYCENFATAMAVMARTLDIPSRVVLGFTPGTPLEDDPSTVVVRDANAHAWVELWIPNQGWMRFDPTPRSQGDTPQTFELLRQNLGFDLTGFLNVPRPERIDFDIVLPPPFAESLTDQLIEGDPLTEPSTNAPTGPDFRLPAWISAAGPWLLGVLVLFGAIPLVKWRRRRKRLERLENGDVTAAWEDIISRLDDLGTRVDPTATPLEAATQIDPDMKPLAAVYGRALYGHADSLQPHHIATAERTFTEMHVKIQNHYSPLKRALSWYRLRSPFETRNRKKE